LVAGNGGAAGAGFGEAAAAAAALAADFIAIAAGETGPLLGMG